MDEGQQVRFVLGGMHFEYDQQKNQTNIRKHGISFRSAARVFFDYDRIELFDEEHSDAENRYDTIGDTSAGMLRQGGGATPLSGRQTIFCSWCTQSGSGRTKRAGRSR